ncbi:MULTISPECIES: hypothetical protein [Photorhabdus]|uniref:Photorhabdus luminescens subsp. laumondii TTO1 complete genome segment 6/17 n=1 Tax=Photorhabdus laumondii subsp. laumondii (strain DSM 15139 / CIP 105565 / TT01) TaxID=243265 RepID=Q7N6A3_PHOLL|nr:MULTISPECIES: hypothetical protein [Photorhabdus]AXG46825.1 hypothetical protein PluTT01m_08590 [Photorhabdus laumondii subsp. laumondii]KTL60608.1 hypothetical protein AA106_12145 [Photorhabdus laumondii subsp. laumondii]NHB60960.1 hypothetical protein [Photorhabdus sp. RW14-46]CAE13950.1 unnamed protein product [Photorhabdus laumondii subsp. laumondii TTO1]
MGQAELENKLSAIVPDTAFKLDERSTLDILNWLQEYAKKIPFDQEKKQFWDSFYFIQANNPQQLADIYQNVNKADGRLPAHQAFVLAFLTLLETTNRLLNTFPARHRDLYYRELLGLKPKKAQADKVALGITLNPDSTESLIAQGTLFDAGQDSAGNPLHYASDTDLLANQGELTDLYWYRRDKDGWQSATPLNHSDNLALPENGIRLFSPTSHDTPVLSGYLITCSLFAMPAGERRIKVTLASEWAGNTDHITATISAGDHWLSLSIKSIDKTTIELGLSSSDAAVTAPDALDNMAFNVPALKLGTTQGPILPEIKGIEVSVNGNRSVRYASDNGIEQTDTASFPFGQSPSLGSGFNLVAPEWYGSENATLTITPQWVGLPTSSFSTWYDKYNPKPASNGVFKVQGYLVTSQKRDALNNAKSQSLFGGTGTPQGQSLTLTLPVMNYPLADSPSPNEWPASVRIELAEQDFMHAQYWQNPTDKNVPYTPQISALQVQFNAKAKPEQFTVYPLTPFGRAEATAKMPTLTHEAFYLGFTGVSPGQTLSLYWQLAGIQALALSWFYLDKSNSWNKLDELVDDQTHNLFDRGIWRTLLPQDAANQAALMPPGRYWLKAEITAQTDPQDYPSIKSPLYNATTATLVNAQAIEQAHFINGLAAGSIKQPTSTLVAISNVTQPWASWNGRPPETEHAFLTRLPARLSHRNRVLSWGNIVTLLKEQFVSLFDVKYPSANELTKIPAPEIQRLIVIPNSRYKDNDDVLRPKLNPARLAEMVEWIKQLSSPWATIEINNPTYVDVNVDYQVTFISGINPDYGHHQLQQQLRRKYMPWGENPTIGVTTGNHIDYYQLLANIQQSPLVERVTNLSITIANRTTGAIGESIEAADDEVLILVWPERHPLNQGVNS